MRTLDKFVPMRSVWLAIILCLGLALPAYATTIAATIFSEDYEVNVLSDLQAKGWTCLPSSCTGTTTDIVTTTRTGAPAHRGSHMLRQTYAGVHVDDCCNSWIMKTWTGVPEIWERYYVRYEAIDPSQPSGFSPITAKQHYFNVGTRPALISTYLFNGPEFAFGYNTPTGVQVICPGTAVLDSTCNLRQNLTKVSTTHDTWLCIESHLSQTVVETWVNGTPTMSQSGSWYTSPALWNNVQIYRQGSDNLYRYEDDYVVATTRVGCSASTGETNPPAAPSGLTLR